MSIQADELRIFADDMHTKGVECADERSFSHGNRQIQAFV